VNLTEAQRELVEQNLGLVNVHIRRFVAVPRSPSRQREYEDLYQEGCLGLMQAARTHDPGRHGPFAAYAMPRIHHAISMALYERFSTVRVPAKSVKRARERQRACPASDRHRPEPALVETHSLAEGSLELGASDQARHRPIAGAWRAGRAWRGERPTVGKRLRIKHEAAVREGGERLSATGRGRQDRAELIRRFVEERLLIPEPDAQTPKRQLARDFDCSIGRIQSCEDALMTEIRALLTVDDEFQALLGLARQDDEGMDLIIDERCAAKLERSALDGFARRFARLPADRQAVVVRDLLRATMGSLARFARRLFGQLDVRHRARFLGAVMGDAAKPSGTRDRRTAGPERATSSRRRHESPVRSVASG